MRWLILNESVNRIVMKRKYWVLFIFCIGILLLDQWTKSMVVQKLPLYQRVKVIQGFFNLTHVRNTGGAFGIFGGEKGGLGSILFVVVSLIANGAIVFLFLKIKENEKTLALSFSLILSGAIGNLIDRLRYGEVVDFLDFYLSTYHWPAFNVADSAICIGIGLMALELLKGDHKKSTKSQAPSDKPVPEEFRNKSK
ncbi:MAG: signal peptidase II [Desulfobacterales bacterium]|nr:signal peptidase II [Desulfobacterales bacterium]